MKPSKAEFMILNACRILASNPPSEQTREAIATFAREHDEEKTIDPKRALDGLIERGWVTLPDGGKPLSLNADAAALAEIAAADISPELFSHWMTKSEGSPTYLRFCELVYGLPFVQFNMVDAEQMASFVRLAALAPGTRLLDLGCGIGTQAEYLSDLTGARVTGVDYAPASITRAKERCAAKAGRLDFLVCDMGSLDALGLPPSSFDAVVAFDTLYFAKDLDRTLGDLVAFLAPSGKLYAFWSEYGKTGTPPSALEPAGTRLGLALTKRGLAFETREFTANDRAVWEKSLTSATELKPGFEAEGALDLYWGRIVETEEILEMLTTGAGRRYLYIVGAGLL
jgi:SAM-dependent methyltransferase